MPAKIHQFPCLSDNFGVLIHDPETGATAAIFRATQNRMQVKQRLQAAGLPTLPAQVLTDPDQAVVWKLYPAIVKGANQHASYGIDRESVVETPIQLAQRVAFLRQAFGDEALVEPFLDTREFHVAVWGNHAPEALPPLEYDYSGFADLRDRLYTYEWKFDRGSRGFNEIKMPCPAPVDRPDWQARLQEIAVRAYTLLGLRDYVRKNRFPGIVLGLSGGIDSALTAAVAVDALGASAVQGVRLPSRFTSDASQDDAAESARLLGIRLDTIPIEAPVVAFEQVLTPVFAERPRDLAEENVQARARGVILMAISNKLGLLLVTTGNKSEMSVGYATLYGDMCGGYSVLKDIYKTEVYALSRWRNQCRPAGALGPEGRVIPESSITKAPTAELRPNQTDQDTLPPYEVLDAILNGLVEEELSVPEIAGRGFPRETVVRVQRMLYAAEYKRRQAPPGVKITRRNFGRDRRYPLTNAFRES